MNHGRAAAGSPATAKKLVGLFLKNFEQYATMAGPDVVAAGPQL